MKDEPDPTAEAAYFASIWKLSNPKMARLEMAFRKFRDHYRPKTAIEVVRSMIEPDTIMTASECHPEGFERKEVYNALTYLTRTGELAHIGYGHYQSPPRSG